MRTIGIDLGTTNSLVAYWSEQGPTIIPNVLGVKLTPSVVSVDDTGEILVGQVAKERLITHPESTAATFKRFMGTEKSYQLGKYSFSAEELSSFVIKSLKADAEAFFGEEVIEAVISVPAYFNDVQRKATKRAAEIAGLRVERLVSEPTAAALSYGLHEKASETAFLVFDLGGGTFDVSILEFYEGVIEVKAIAGDNFLGGEDFTHVLVSYFCEVNGLDIQSLDLKIRSALYKQGELCKCVLSQENSGKMSLVINGETLQTTVDRDKFNDLVEQLLLRLHTPIDRALRDSGILPSDLNAIILIGGSTRMPVIRTVAAKIFKQLPYNNINPDEAVALGAAIQVAMKEKNETFRETILTDVCPYTLGAEISRSVKDGNYLSGCFLPIIKRNTPIPVSKVERLGTISDNQTQIKINIYQGESRHVNDNLKLGEVSIGIPPAPAGEMPVDVRYTYDINGILEVEVVSVITGTKNRVVIKNSPGSLSEVEIEKSLKMLEGIKIHPRDRTENRLLLAKGERLYQEALEYREDIDFLLSGFEYELSRQNDRDIKKAAKELKIKLEQIEKAWWY